MVNDLKNRVKERMEALKISQADLARAAQVSRPTVFNWIGGRTQEIKGEPLLRAAKALGVTPQWLRAGSGPKFPESAAPTYTLQEPATRYIAQPQYDPWTTEAISIFTALAEEDRRGAVAVLRSYAQNLGPPATAKIYK